MDIQVYIQSGVIESYVLGLASEEEAAELHRLAAMHPEVRLALQDAEIAFEKNALENGTAPDAGLKDTLLAALQKDFVPETSQLYATNIAAATTSELPPITLYRKTERWRYIAAAAVILFIVSAALNFYYYNHYQQANEKYQALLTEKTSIQASMDVYKARLQEATASMQVIQNPVMAIVKMAGVPGKENNLATIYWNTQTKDVYVLSNQLPQAPAGKQYQLWAIVDGKPVDAGVLGTCGEGICRMKNIPAAQAFAITLEKQGGNPTPTLTEMYVMGKV